MKSRFQIRTIAAIPLFSIGIFLLYTSMIILICSASLPSFATVIFLPQPTKATKKCDLTAAEYNRSWQLNVAKQLDRETDSVKRAQFRKMIGAYHDEDPRIQHYLDAGFKFSLDTITPPRLTKLIKYVESKIKFQVHRGLLSEKNAWTLANVGTAPRVEGEQRTYYVMDPLANYRLEVEPEVDWFTIPGRVMGAMFRKRFVPFTAGQRSMHDIAHMFPLLHYPRYADRFFDLIDLDYEALGLATEHHRNMVKYAFEGLSLMPASSRSVLHHQLPSGLGGEAYSREMISYDLMHLRIEDLAPRELLAKTQLALQTYTEHIVHYGGAGYEIGRSYPHVEWLWESLAIQADILRARIAEGEMFDQKIAARELATFLTYMWNSTFISIDQFFSDLTNTDIQHNLVFEFFVSTQATNDLNAHPAKPSGIMFRAMKALRESRSN